MISPNLPTEAGSAIAACPQLFPARFSITPLMGRFNNPLNNLSLCLTTLTVKKWGVYVQMEFSVLHIVPITSCLSLNGQHREESESSFSISPSGILTHWQDPPQLSVHQVKHPRSLSSFSHQRCLMALHWTFPRKFMPFLYWGVNGPVGISDFGHVHMGTQAHTHAVTSICAHYSLISM